MGEEADYLIDRMIEQGDWFHRPVRTEVIRCKRCRAQNLYWKEVRTVPGNQKAWRLFETATNEQHQCINESEMWD